MGSGLIIAINASLSNILKSVANSKALSETKKNLGEITLYFGTSISLKLRLEHLEWLVLL